MHRKYPSARTSTDAALNAATNIANASLRDFKSLLIPFNKFVVHGLYTRKHSPSETVSAKPAGTLIDLKKLPLKLAKALEQNADRIGRA